MSAVSRSIDRVEATFDDDTLVADAGLIVPATLMVRLGLEGWSTPRCGWSAGSVALCRAARC